MGEKINIGRLNLVGLTLLIVGLFLIGFAITGKVISNGNTSSDYCNSDNECANGKTCCIISGPNGMCQSLEICNELKSNLGVETPLKEYSGSYVNAGIVIVIFAVIIFIIGYYYNHKKKIQGNSRNSRNKKFKRRR